MENTKKSLDILTATIINSLTKLVESLLSSKTWTVIFFIALFILAVGMMFNPFIPSPSGGFLIDSSTLSAVVSFTGFFIVCAYTDLG